MKVLHVPFCYHPDPIGGTEVYVKSLLLGLSDLGVDGAIAAPGFKEASYVHDGFSVHRFAVDSGTPFAQAYGTPDQVAARSFARILGRERPDVVHLHAFTSAVSVLLVSAAQAAGARVVFTYHTPTVTCARGTLMRWGTVPCDGVMTARRCTACNLTKHALPQPIAIPLAYIPTWLGRGLIRAGLVGGAWTALSMRFLVQERQRMARSFLNTVDHVIAVCDWVYRLLMANGVSADRLSLSRQGLPFPPENGIVQPKSSADKRYGLRLAFLGRLDWTKGPDLLADILCNLPGLPISIDIFGVSQSQAPDNYTSVLARAAANDSRISLKIPVDPREVVPLLRGYDLVAVPSRWLESGPLVILEAFAAGVPVIASRIGGIMELVEEQINGVLVPPDDVSAWSSELRRLLEEPERLAQLRRGVKDPRQMIDAAHDMKAIYVRLMDRVC